MTLEQLLEAIKGLSPEDKAKLMEGLEPAATPPAEPPKEPGTKEPAAAEGDPKEKTKEGNSAEPPAEPAKPAEPINEPGAVPPTPPAVPEQNTDIKAAILEALAPLVMEIETLKTAVKGMQQEPQKVADPAMQEKLNKAAGIYGN